MKRKYKETQGRYSDIILGITKWHNQQFQQLPIKAQLDWRMLVYPSDRGSMSGWGSIATLLFSSTLVRCFFAQCHLLFPAVYAPEFSCNIWNTDQAIASATAPGYIYWLKRRSSTCCSPVLFLSSSPDLLTSKFGWNSSKEEAGHWGVLNIVVRKRPSVRCVSPNSCISVLYNW